MSNSFDYHSRQAYNYRSAGMEADALRNEHFMRLEMLNNIGGNSSDKNVYADSSRRYYEAKAAGREADAARHQKDMDIAMMNMIRR